MSTKRHERTLARRSAIQLLYQGDMLGTSACAIADDERYLADSNEAPLSNYALMLLQTIESHQTAIDERLEAASDNWLLSRMPVVDRAILRLAVGEMIYVDDVPISVSINEAVELAKDFGGEDDSPRFVNGVLGRIASSLEEGQNQMSQDQMAGAPSDDASDDADAAHECAAAQPVSPVVSELRELAAKEVCNGE